MKKKNGFTLVELLVTIALMLTILGIAIVSFVNVSNNKKEEAWSNVKSQIETAALEYFTANEYLFEGLSNTVTGAITVGKLVNEDYLNRVVNPIDGNTVNYCSYVEVTKEDQRYKVSYVEDEILEENDNGECVSVATVIIKEPGAPSGKVVYKDKNDKNVSMTDDGWFNSDKLGKNGRLKICVKADTEGNGAIIDAKIGNYDVEEVENNYYCTINTIGDMKKTHTNISLTNSAGKTWVSNNTIGIDTTPPGGEITIIDNEEYAKGVHSNIVDVTINADDNISGVQSIEFDDHTKKGNTFEEDNYKIASSLDGKTYTLSAKVYDNAGNKGNITSDSYSVYGECSRTKEKNFYTGSCNNNGYKMKRISKVDEYTGTVCENGVPFKVDCAVESIVFALNYNNGNASSNPGMKGVGPMASNGKGRIFKSNTGAEDYSTGKRGMNVSTGWDGTKLNGRSSSCNPWENADCTATDAGYAASSCKDVSDFQRRFRFKVKWTDGTVSNEQFINLDGTGPSYKTYFTGRNTDLRVMISEDLSEKIYRYGCSNGSNINVRTCGESSGGTPNVTTHVYYLQAGGKTSNTVSLYTKYFVNCGY